jgi:hypothetical protein
MRLPWKAAAAAAAAAALACGHEARQAGQQRPHPVGRQAGDRVSHPAQHELLTAARQLRERGGHEGGVEYGRQAERGDAAV